MIFSFLLLMSLVWNTTYPAQLKWAILRKMILTNTFHSASVIIPHLLGPTFSTFTTCAI